MFLLAFVIIRCQPLFNYVHISVFLKPMKYNQRVAILGEYSFASLEYW